MKSGHEYVSNSEMDVFLQDQVADPGRLAGEIKGLCGDEKGPFLDGNYLAL